MAVYLRSVSFAALLLALTFSFEKQAHAYADPGSGLLLFQAGASVLTGLFYICNKRIRAFVSRFKGESKVSSPEQG